MSDAEYAILGAVTVRRTRDAAPTRLSEQRELLIGRLLLEPGARVTTHALAEALWGDEERSDPRNGVQQAVRSARSLLGDTTQPFRVIVREGDGYRLVVDPLRIDAVRFRRLAARGRDLLGRRPRAARAMLAEALSTWRGRLLGEHADRPWVAGYASELDSVRDAVEVDLNEARLALGEHDAVERALRRQTALHPQDERRRGQLVRALHCAGRTAEAMTAYREAVRELGGAGTELRVIGAAVAGGTRVEPATATPAAPHGAAPARRDDGLLLCAVLGGDERSPEDPGVGTATLLVDQHGGEPRPVSDDRLVATFADPDDALRAAAAMASHARLNAGIGGHAGGVIYIGDGLSGPGLARCWQLARAAHPGQVLLSVDARRRVSGSHDLRDLGEQRFFDLGEREAVFELRWPASAGPFAPLATLDRLPNNLPVLQTRFVGRQAEQAALSRLVAGGELMTLIGPGGCGKTRLALQLAAAQLPAFADGAWFVTLAQLAPGAGVKPVAAAVAHELGVRALPGEALPEAVVRHLSDRAALLVLDNCEQVHEACAELVAALLADCRDVCVVATSRRPLRVDAERIWPVPPMAIEGADEPDRPSDAVMLLLERAGLLAGETTGREAIACAERICNALDGLPLAIELAAGQVALRGLAGVAVEVEATMRGDRPLVLLASGDRRRPDRQRTLEAAMDWSYRLLSDDERCVLRRLAVFRGSFGATEAGLVAFDDVLDAAAVAEILSSLVECSMVAPVAPLGGATRMRLVEPIRAFALTRLEDEADHERIRERHADVFRALAERSAPALFGPDEHACLERLEADHDNIRAALRRYVDTGRGREALRLVGALWWLWFSHGHLEEGGHWVRRALALGGDPGRERVRALRAGSHLSWWLGDFAQAERYNADLEACAAAIGDDWGRAWAPMGFGAVELFRDPQRALALFEDSKRRFDSLGRRWEAGYAMQVIGGARWFGGDEPAAREAFEEAVGIFEQLGHRSVLASVMRSAGLMSARCGSAARGEALCSAALRLSNAVGDRAGSAQALNFLAAISRDAGDLDAAVERNADALSLAREVGELWATCWALDGLGGAARAAGEPEVAARLLAHSGRLAARAGYRQPPLERALREQDIAALRATLDPQDYERAVAEGGLMSVGETVACALAFAARRS